MDFFSNPEVISNLLGYFGTALQILVLILLLLGPFRSYVLLLIYVLFSAVMNAAEGWVLDTYGVDLEHYYPVYWGGELIGDVLLLLVTISLARRALDKSPARSSALKFMAAVFVLSLVLPFVLYRGNFWVTRWNESASQLLNFAAAILNLVLWGALISNRNRDRKILLVSAGLGIALASAALTLGMRKMTGEDTIARSIADYAHRLLQIGSVGIWCYAFWPRKTAAPTTTPV